MKMSEASRALVFVLVGCSPGAEVMAPQDDADTGTESLESTGVVPSDAETTSTGNASDGAGGDDETSGGSAPAECGNGVVEDGEVCDDDTVACRDDCQRSCTLALDVGGDAGRYQGLAIDEDGRLHVAGTDLTGQKEATFVGTLTDDLVEDTRQVLDADTGALARGLIHHEDGALSLLRLRADETAPNNVALGLVRYEGDEVLWDTEIKDAVLQGFGLTDPSAAALPGGGAVVATSFAAEDGGRKILLGRYDANGNVSQSVLEPMVDGVAGDHGSRVVAGPDGAVTVAGARRSVLGGPGIFDPLVVHVGPNDEPMWTWSEWTESTNLQLSVRGSARDGAGRVAFSFNLDHGVPAAAHAWFVVFESDGKVAWQLDTDDIDDEARETAKLVFDAADRLISVGYGRPPGEIASVRVTGFDGEGTIVCDEPLVGTAINVGDVVLDANGDIVAAGYTTDDNVQSFVAAMRIRGMQ